MVRLLRGFLLVAALVLSACSGDDGSTTDETTSVDETEASDETETDETTTTEATTTTTTIPIETDPDDPVVIGYCEASAEAQSLSLTADLSAPEGFRDVISGQRELLESVEPPPAIADALQTILFGFVEVETQLASAVDIGQANAAVSILGSTPEFAIAGQRIDAFEAEFCGAPGGPPSTVDNNLGITEEEILELLESEEDRLGIAQGLTSTTTLTEEEALCFVDSAEPSVLVEMFLLGTGEQTAPSANLQTLMIEALDACGLDQSVFG